MAAGPAPKPTSLPPRGGTKRSGSDVETESEPTSCRLTLLYTAGLQSTGRRSQNNRGRGRPPRPQVKRKSRGTPEVEGEEASVERRSRPGQRASRWRSLPDGQRRLRCPVFGLTEFNVPPPVEVHPFIRSEPPDRPGATPGLPPSQAASHRLPPCRHPSSLGRQ